MKILIDNSGYCLKNYGDSAMFEQGLGPVSNRNLEKWAKRVLPNFQALTLRESVFSIPFTKKLGMSKKQVILTGDDAIYEVRKQASEVLGSGIGINLRVAKYSGMDGSELSSIKDIFERVSTKLAANLVGIPISDHDGDSDVHALQTLLESSSFEKVKLIDSPKMVMNAAGQCRVVITGSYHVGVFALSQGVSVIGVASNDYYRQKFKGLKNQFGEGCNVVDKDSLDFLERLEQSILESWKCAPQVRQLLIKRAEDQIRLSDKAYSDLKKRLY